MRFSLRPCLLLGGMALAAGWGTARLMPAGPSGTIHAVVASGGPSLPEPNDTEFRAKTAAAPFPGVHDPLVMAALDNPDLIAAVRGILASGRDDNGTGIRLLQLIESLPDDRLPEVPVLLESLACLPDVLPNVLTAWAVRQPGEALAWARKKPAMDATLHGAVLTGWARQDPAAATAWLLAQPVASHTPELQTTLLETLSETAPASALKLAKVQGWTETNRPGITALLRNWASQDPAAAFAAMATLSAGSAASSGPRRADWLGALLAGAARRPPQEIADLISRFSIEDTVEAAPFIARDYLIPHPEARQALLTNPAPGIPEKALLRALARHGAGDVLEHLGGFKDPAFRQDLLAAALGETSSSNWGSVALGQHLAGSSRAQSGVMSVLSCLSPGSREPLISRLLSVIPQENPGFAAIVWEQLDPAGQQDSMHRFIQKLGQQAPEEARKIWESSPPETQAKSLRGLMAGLSWQKPQEAVALALQQPDPELRTDALTVALAHWAERDPASALTEFERLLPRIDLPAMNRLLPEAVLIDGQRYYFTNILLKQRLKVPTETPAP